VPFDDRPHINSCHSTVFHHDLAVYHGMRGLLRGAEYNCRHRIVQSTREVHRVQIDTEEVSALADSNEPMSSSLPSTAAPPRVPISITSRAEQSGHALTSLESPVKLIVEPM
jgi:hypothetical protein